MLEDWSGFWLFIFPRGPFLWPKSYFEIEVSRKVGCVLTCNEVYFVSLADNFGVQFSKLLKLPSGMGPLITGSFEKQAPDHLGVGKTPDGRTSVTVKMGKTRDGTVRDIYVTDP